jgi:hypothetical protein
MSSKWWVSFLVSFPLLAQYAGPGSPSLTVEEKFKYHGMKTIEPAAWLRFGVTAAFDQLRNDPKEWMQGAEGYGKRYGSAAGTNALRHMMGFGLDSALHEDPRFIRSDKTGFGARLKYALMQTLIVRTDSGGRSFAFAKVGSAYGSNLLSNTWRPHSVNGTGDAMVRGTTTIGIDAASNVIREFWRRKK